MQATIHNEFLTLTVDTHGAEAVSLKNAAGQETPSGWNCARMKRARQSASRLILS